MSDEQKLWERYRRLPEAQREPGPCPDAQALAAYAEHRSSGAAQTELEAHLALCGACRNAVRTAQHVLAETATTAAPPVRKQIHWSAWPLRAAVAVFVASLLLLAYSAGSRVAMAVSGAATNQPDDTLGSEF